MAFAACSSFVGSAGSTAIIFSYISCKREGDQYIYQSCSYIHTLTCTSYNRNNLAIMVAHDIIIIFKNDASSRFGKQSRNIVCIHSLLSSLPSLPFFFSTTRTRMYISPHLQLFLCLSLWLTLAVKPYIILLLKMLLNSLPNFHSDRGLL